MWTAITTAELRYGVDRLPDGRRKADLAERLRRIIDEGFAGRVLAFDDEAASHYAVVVMSRERRGLHMTLADAQIAAICRSRTHATRRVSWSFARSSATRSTRTAACR